MSIDWRGPREHRHVGLDTGWHQLPFLNGWSAWDTDVNWDTGQYHLDALGFVHLRGLIKSPATAPTLGQLIAGPLPLGYRPRRYHFFCCPSAGSNYVNWYVQPDGIISMQGYGPASPAAPPASSYYSIAGCVFPVF